MAPEPDVASPPPAPCRRLRDGVISALFLTGAMLILLGLTRTVVIAYAQQLDLFYVTAMLIALAIPGPILRRWDLPGQLLLWNATGWCLGLAILGMASFGATPMLPLILIAFALSFWPRANGAPLPWLGASIGLIGGFLVCWALWGSPSADIPFMNKGGAGAPGSVLLLLNGIPAPSSRSGRCPHRSARDRLPPVDGQTR